MVIHINLWIVLGTLYLASKLAFAIYLQPLYRKYFTTLPQDEWPKANYGLYWQFLRNFGYGLELCLFKVLIYPVKKLITGAEFLESVAPVEILMKKVCPKCKYIKCECNWDKNLGINCDKNPAIPNELMPNPGTDVTYRSGHQCTRCTRCHKTISSGRIIKQKVVCHDCFWAMPGLL